MKKHGGGNVIKHPQPLNIKSRMFNILNIWFEKGVGGSAYGSPEWLKKRPVAK